MLLTWRRRVVVSITGIFGNFLTSRGRILQSWNGNSRWPCCVFSKKNTDVTWHEAARKTAGQHVLETTIKKGWPLCWSCAMHGRLHLEDSRRAKQALHWIRDENRNSGQPCITWQDTISGDIDLMDTKMSVSRQWKEKSGKIYFLIWAASHWTDQGFVL